MQPGAAGFGSRWWLWPVATVDDQPSPAKPKRRPKAPPPQQNVVGPLVARIRQDMGLSQDALAARCARLGWDLSENGVTKIETQVRCVTDRELFVLALALRVKLAELVPPTERHKLF